MKSPKEESQVLQLLSFSESEKKTLQTFENCSQVFSNLAPIFNEDPKSMNSLFETLQGIKKKEEENEKVIRELFEKLRIEKAYLNSELNKNRNEYEKNRYQMEEEREKLINELTKLKKENNVVNNDLIKVKNEKKYLEMENINVKQNLTTRKNELEREIQNLKAIITKKDEHLTIFFQEKKDLNEIIKKVSEEKDEILKKNKSQSEEIFNLIEEKSKLERLFNETKHCSSDPNNQTSEEKSTQNQSIFVISKEQMEIIKKENENFSTKERENREEIQKLKSEKQKLIEINEQNEIKLKDFDESIKKLKGRYEKYKSRSQTFSEEKNTLINENEQLKNEKICNQAQLKALEQDLKTIKESYVALQKFISEEEKKKNVLLIENERLKNEQEGLNLKLKNLEKENMYESQEENLRKQASDRKKVEENVLSLQNSIKLVEQEKNKLSIEIEILKKEKTELNLKINELKSQKIESNEKFQTKRSLDMENNEKSQNFMHVQKINELEFSLDILDESISDVTFETGNNPMEFNLEYKRNLSATFFDPKSYLKSKHMIKEQSSIQFSLDQQKIFKFDKLNERQIKKYNERHYQIKYIYSGSYISKKPFDKETIKLIPEMIEEEKTTHIDPVQDKITHISNNSIDLENPSANQGIQKKSPNTPKFKDKSLSSGSGLSSRTQKAEEFDHNQKETIKENKDENPNFDDEGRKKASEKDIMLPSIISEINGSSYRISNPNKKDFDFDSENSSDCGSNFRIKDKFNENSTLYPIHEDSELKDKLVKQTGSISYSSEYEMEKSEKCQKGKKKSSEIAEEYDFATPEGPREVISCGLSLKNAPLENSSDIYYESNIKVNIPYQVKKTNLKESEFLSEEEEN